jgi:hypothetical protein
MADSVGSCPPAASTAQANQTTNLRTATDTKNYTGSGSLRSQSRLAQALAGMDPWR